MNKILPRRVARKRRMLIRRGLLAFLGGGIAIALVAGGGTVALASSTPIEDEVVSTSEVIVTPTEGTVENSTPSEGTTEPEPEPEVVPNDESSAPEPAAPATQPAPTPEEPSADPELESKPDVAPAPQQAVTQTAKAAQAKPSDPVNYGTIGTLQPGSNDANQASYWKARVPNALECYKYEGRAMLDNDHAYLTNDGKTVVLKPYGASWPGDHWAALIVKASTWDAVNLNPTAGAHYAAYDNKEISHYIVCKGDKPEQPKPTVTITGNEQCVPASGTYTVTWTVTIANYGSLSEVDLKAISHSPSGSLINGVNGQVWFYEWLEHNANHGLPAFPPGGTFTFTQSNIPGTATSASTTIQYDFKNGPSGDPIGNVTLGGDCAPPPPTDVCKNIGGNQENVPEGYIGVGDKCYEIKTRTEKGEWKEETADCKAGTVTSTRTVWTVTYYVKYGEEVEISRTSEVKHKERPLNEQEIEDCAPELPEDKVTYTDWMDEEWACGDTSVTQNRTKTTTPWKWVYLGEGTYEFQLDTANAVTVPETKTRPLTDDELETCVPVVPMWVDECGAGNGHWVYENTEWYEYVVVLNDDGSQTISAVGLNGFNFSPDVTTSWTEKDSGEECELFIGGVQSQCIGDVPHFQWSDLSFEEGFTPTEGQTMTITFLHPTDPSQNYVVSGVTISTDGSVLWPGASDGSDGLPKQWPGWALQEDGSYVETEGNYRWTRDSAGIDVLFQVNPELVTHVTYPVASALCANPPVKTPEPTPTPTPTPTPAGTSTPASTPPSGMLPPTGLNLIQTILIALAGGLLLAAGAYAKWGRRRTV